MTLGCDRFAMRHVDDQSKILRLSFHRGELQFCEAAAGRAQDPWHREGVGQPLGIGQTLLGKFMSDLHPLPDRLLLPAVDIVLEHRAAAATGFLPS